MFKNPIRHSLVIFLVDNIVLLCEQKRSVAIYHFSESGGASPPAVIYKNDDIAAGGEFVCLALNLL